jgi:hypothetical protein
VSTQNVGYIIALGIISDIDLVVELRDPESCVNLVGDSSRQLLSQGNTASLVLEAALWTTLVLGDLAEAVVVAYGIPSRLPWSRLIVASLA